MAPGHSRFAVAPSGWTVLLSGRQAPPDHIWPGTTCLRPAIPSALRLRPQRNGAGSRRPWSPPRAHGSWRAANEPAFWPEHAGLWPHPLRADLLWEYTGKGTNPL